MSFDNLNLIAPIQEALKDQGYSNPTPIQAQSIPLVLEGRDLLGCAQTGTGKTAAFAIPIIQLLEKNNRPLKGKRPIRSLILTPTRELAIQIGESFENYGKRTGLRYRTIFGGVGKQPQIDALRKGIDVLIATPGRLLDLMNEGYIDLQRLEIFVLDEADRMLDMGFVHDVRRVIKKLPQKRQSLFFSATMPPAIVQLAGTILRNPEKVEVAPVSSTADTIDQSVYLIDKGNKRKLLVDLLQDPAIEMALIFTRTKHGADRVVKDLAKADIKAMAIHGNKSQSARQKALKNFKDKTIRVLVATDIAARGIDIDELTHVINFELPNIPESYVHRIGRTGRAGAAGIAISFCDASEKSYLKDIEKLIGRKVKLVDDHPYPLMIHDAQKPVQGQGRTKRNNSSRPSGKKPNNRKWNGPKRTN